MKLSLLVAGLMAFPTLGAKGNKKTSVTPPPPTIPDIKALKYIPGMEDLFAQATQHGKSEKEVDLEVKDIIVSLRMANVVADFQKKQACGASLDGLVDYAFDSVLGKKNTPDKSMRDIFDDCHNACVGLKQCMLLEGTNVAVEECGKEKVKSDCKASCTPQ